MGTENALRPFIPLIYLFLLIGVVSPSFGLALEYNRNGEAYLLLGGGPYQGVYRLSDPAAESLKLGYLYNPNDTIGISVDLYRNIYTFSEKITPGYLTLSGDIPRQVVDNSVTAAKADFGYHNYIHYDHRGAGETAKPVYRTGPAGRGITRYQGGTWSGFTSGGPGIGISAPPGNPLPIINGVQDPIFPGRSWYSIPNGAWYSTWQTGTTNGSNGGTFYKVFQDTLQGQAHNWKLNSWKDGSGAYPVEGNTVGTSYDTRWYRRIYAGCLDGCGGASGSGSGNAKPMFTSVAFMPPIGGNPSRTYFYSREEDSNVYSVTLAVGAGGPINYVSAAGNSIIGYPGDVGTPVSRGTRWIAVSLRDKTSDFVYSLGTKVIGEWYQQVTSSPPPPGFTIDAVTVSNQWNQLGGIVFAYDKSQGAIYKFIRNETQSPPVSAIGFDTLSLGNDIDDIKSDGFGSLYYAKTIATPAQADPRTSFNMDADVIDAIPDSVYPAITFGRAICAQEFRKTVFERRITDGMTYSIGSKNLGYKYYARSFIMPSGTWATLKTSPYSNFESKMLAAGGAWLGWTVAGPQYVDTLSPPSKTELATINVPTPPKVLAFPGYTSHLDIVGPFDSAFTPAPTATGTNQGIKLFPADTELLPGRNYWYMVENYPLDPPLDPNEQTDWNNNGWKGGFITSITNPAPSGDDGKVFYRWRLWTVAWLDMDPQAKQSELVATPAADPEIPGPPDYPTPSGDIESFPMYSPVGGKYILTCQVSYDWFDYDALPFGSMYSERFTALRKGTRAVSIGKDAQIATIKADSRFSFMNWATMSSYLDRMIPDDTWAAIPISVAYATGPRPLATETALVERCDNRSMANDNSYWADHETDGYHGVFAGKDYGWRMALASQANLFFDIENIPDPSLNYVAQRLLDPQSPLYANTEPGYVFRNLKGDLRWEDSFATFEGYIVATMPSNASKLQHIFGATTCQSTAATYSFGLIDLPSDPRFYNLEIKARRRFAFRMWPKKILPGGAEVWGRPQFSKNFIEIVARTQILAIDQTPPILDEQFTAPRNLFAFTGDQLQPGIGPDAFKNPATVQFVYRDNNPWENGPDTDNGLSIADSESNEGANNITARDHPGDSRYNMKPVFSKARRWIYFSYSTNSPASHSISFASGTENFDEFYKAGRGANPGTYLSLRNLNTPSGPFGTFVDVTESYLEASLGTARICFGSNQSRTVPRNYANNTPGYQPYPFYVQMMDGSGNLATFTPLNLVMNVRDNIPPIPWATLRDLKNIDDSERGFRNERTFPQFLLATGKTVATAGLTLDNNFLDRTPEWKADSEGKIPSTNPSLYLLKSLGSNIVSPFADADLTKQINAKIQPNFMEENVEFELWAGVSDNAGIATNTVSMRFYKPDESEDILTADSSTRWPPVSPATGSTVVGMFRGIPGNFPIAFPVTMRAEDSALDWTYYVNPTTLSPDEWTTKSKLLFPPNPAKAPNARSVLTTIPLFETKSVVRILDKSLRQRNP